MGAYQYMTEIARKKQSDINRFTQRIRCWHYRQLPAVHRAPRPTRPDKARKLGYKAKQGMLAMHLKFKSPFYLKVYVKFKISWYCFVDLSCIGFYLDFTKL